MGRDNARAVKIEERRSIPETRSRNAGSRRRQRRSRTGGTHRGVGALQERPRTSEEPRRNHAVENHAAERGTRHERPDGIAPKRLCGAGTLHESASRHGSTDRIVAHDTTTAAPMTGQVNSHRLNRPLKYTPLVAFPGSGQSRTRGRARRNAARHRSRGRSASAGVPNDA